MERFRPDNVRAHLKFLASDLLEGRGPGQRGGDLAVKYIATQFALAGLQPAVNGSFVQPVPLVGVQTGPASTIAFVKDGQQLKPAYLDEFVGNDETQSESSQLDAPLVFLGYGVDAPEYNWNDYQDADVRGKALVILVNDPPSPDPKHFGGKALTYYGRWTYKFEQATRKGAAAVLLVHTPQSAGYGWEVVRNSWGREQPFVRVASGEHKLKFAGWITEQTARKLMGLAGQDLDRLTAAAAERGFRAVPLGVALQGRLESKTREIRTANVIGKLEGSDPKLKQEAIVYTAHHDHLGIDPDASGDQIYNGAVDNASGTALLMEMARAFAAAPVRPRRSVLFAAVAAEEGGLRGSEYYARNPVVPAGQTAVNIHYDGIEFLGATRDVQMLGVERTTLEPVAQAAARALGFRLVPDQHPEQGYYYRSDHFSLAKTGIPAFSLRLGNEVIGKPEGWGAAKDEEYRKNRYHQPSDEFRDDWDYSAARQAASIGAYIGWEAATTPRLPAWKKGDEFEAARLASQKGN